MEIPVLKRNKIYFEAMRIVATYFVIFNHTDANGYWLYAQYERTAPQYWLYMPVSVFCRFSVWLFLMISGALLLEKQESYRKGIKRISRIMIVLIAFSFLYYFQQIKLEGTAFNIKSFLLQLYMGKINPYFWYLYAYIAFLLSLPLLKKLIHSLDVKEFNYMIIIEMLFVGILPIGEFILFGGVKH